MMPRTSLTVLSAVVALSACSDSAPIAGPDQEDTGAPIEQGDVQQRHAFVVTLAPKANAADVARDHKLVPTHVYSKVMNGFATSMSELGRSGVMRDMRVVKVERDQPYTTAGIQSGATWGLDRIDQRSGLDGSYTFDRTGQGVTAYIVDTGIRPTHREFGGRAAIGFDAFGGDGTDCRGHGTHVAGTVGGASYGVAKAVKLIGVRVLDCKGSGTSSTLLAGLDWVLANAARPAVVNLSLGGPADPLVDEGVRRVIAAGIPVVVAAGNSYKSACSYSPSRVTEALTIGATVQSDQKSIFSNYGNCVDWFAPGEAITSAGTTTDTSTAKMSGTSMAAPHTTGAVALYLESHPDAAPTEVAASLSASLTRGVVTSSFSVNNHLLYTRGDGGTAPVNSQPVASFQASCAELECSFTDGSTDADGNVTNWRWDFGDGATSVERSPTHAYAAGGTFRVALTVTDDDGASTTTQRDVTPSDPTTPPDTTTPPGTTTPTVNHPPTASFSLSCMRLECTFRDFSSDPDGTLVRWSWAFGDGNAALSDAAADPVHVFAAGGRYRVTLEVTDDDGAVATTSEDVAVGVVLSIRGRKQKGRHVIDLTWAGAETSQVDVYVDGRLEATATNNGAYTYQASARGQATYRLKVCEAGSSMCSLEQSVTM